MLRSSQRLRWPSSHPAGRRGASAEGDRLPGVGLMLSKVVIVLVPKDKHNE
jgi:hypothetical protein